MMTYRRLTTIVVCSLLIIGLAVSTAFAGLAARTDRGGKYAGTRMSGDDEQTGNPGWQPPRKRVAGAHPLNPFGVANGDLWPTVAESNISPYYPWVVWSRFNGENYDMAWSRWRGRDWTPVQWIEQKSTPGDDLDADIDFNFQGRPYAVWWREENGIGQVFISVFLIESWTTAWPVSTAGVDSRYPTVDVGGPGQIVVEYETAEGFLKQTVLFSRPVTITDDINPLTYFKLGERVLMPARGR